LNFTAKEEMHPVDKKMALSERHRLFHAISTARPIIGAHILISERHII
jgi:hypothetical protein